MSVTLEELQSFVDKEAIVHLVQDDESVKEVTATIKMVTAAGIAIKIKGHSSLQFIDSLSKIEEISAAPIKAKAVVQKKIAPIELGAARQHLVDRHGVELEWAKTADEAQAFEYHASIDHSILGHIHVAKEEKVKDAREEALAES